MTVQKLFESLDEKIFTAELKQSLTEKFDEAVQAKAEVQAQIIADELTESKIDELDDKAEQYGAYLLEESQAKIDEFKESITEKLTDYMDLVVQEFVTEAKDSLEESIKSEKADMLIEAFDSMLIASGVEFSTIMESKDKLQESQSATDRVDQLVEEVIKLKEENTQLIKMGLIAEMSEGLTLVQSERFARLSSIVEFNDMREYSEKLDTLLESVKEYKSEDRLDETAKSTQGSGSQAIWSHLL